MCTSFVREKRHKSARGQTSAVLSCKSKAFYSEGTFWIVFVQMVDKRDFSIKKFEDADAKRQKVNKLLQFIIVNKRIILDFQLWVQRDLQNSKVIFWIVAVYMVDIKAFSSEESKVIKGQKVNKLL